MRSLGRWVVLAAVALLVPASAFAWWNKEWAYRTRVELAPATAGAQVVPVRLHIGSFAFEDAKPDGADLRFVGADDKTPLNYHFEVFDSGEQIAVAWVQVPPAGADAAARSMWMYFGNGNAPAVASARASFDASDAAVFHFAEKEGLPLDATSFATQPARFTGTLGATGVTDGGARFAATQSLVFPSAPQLDVAAGRGFTLSGWVKPEGAEASGLLFSRASGKSALQFGFAKGRAYVQVTIDGAKPLRVETSGALAPGAWRHFALVWSDRLVLYLEGNPAVTLAVPATAIGGEPTIGAHPALGPGFVGGLDELQFASVARPAAWVAAAAAAQDPTAEAVTFADEEQGGGSQYLAVLRTLVNAVSTDGWVIMGLIAVLGLISGEVMISKLLLLRRIESANSTFLEGYRAMEADPTAMLAAQRAASPDAQRLLGNSALFALYRGGVEEFARQRDSVVAGGGVALAPANLEIIKANIDTTIVNEASRMNRSMVLLTLSVSAAPFLGLLGTVVGIMVTFGAIALAGDVNVNTIAPGVAAALATTVAGLAVAIPVMFGYNLLVTMIRELTTSMEIFANELVGRLAASRVAG